nr:hypothetical protein [Streptomyces sp. GC420]
MIFGKTYDEALHDWAVGVCQGNDPSVKNYGAFCSTANKAGLLEPAGNDPFGVQANINCLTGKGDCVEAIVTDVLYLVGIGWNRATARVVAGEVAATGKSVSGTLARLADDCSSCSTSAADAERLRRQLAGEAGQLPGIRSADDIFDTPSALSGGVTPDQVRPFFAGRKGWVEEGLGRGKNAGGGWVIREYTGRGDPTGRMLRWNPGGGHHGEGAYWRVVGPEGDLGGIIR